MKGSVSKMISLVLGPLTQLHGWCSASTVTVRVPRWYCTAAVSQILCTCPVIPLPAMRCCSLHNHIKLSTRIQAVLAAQMLLHCHARLLYAAALPHANCHQPPATGSMQHQAQPAQLMSRKLHSTLEEDRRVFNLEHSGDFRNEVPGDYTSAPMLCYRGSRYFTETFINVLTTDGISSYEASKTSSGEQNVCASYRSQSIATGNWSWHYRVMTSSACSYLEWIASDAGTNVTDVTCCNTPYCNRPGEYWPQLISMVYLACMPK